MNDLKRIRAALSQLYLENDPIFERLEQLVDLMSSFGFGSGDSKSVWVNRGIAVSATCGNCGFKWIAGFMPMPKKRLDYVLERAGFCVRCCEAEEVYLRQVKLQPKPIDLRNNAVQSGQKQSVEVPIFRHAAK